LICGAGERLRKISWQGRTTNVEVLHRLKKEKNIPRTGKRSKINWIIHIFRKKRLIKDVTESKTEGNIERLERRRKICKQLLDDLKETRGY